MRELVLSAKITARLRQIGDFPATAPKPLRAALWLFFALAAAFLIYPDGWVYPGGDSNFLGVIDHFVSHGKTLLYGLPPLRDVRMPLIGVVSLAAGNVNWAGMQVLWTLVSFSVLFSAYALGCLLSGRPAGVAAAAVLFSGQAYPVLFFEIEQRVYCLFLLLVLNALALSRFSPRVRRLAEGCAIGISFLARSALCLFPLVLAVPELFRKGAGGLRRRAASAALVFIVPFIFLLPWSVYNYGVNNTFMLFDGRGEWNVVTGAMGMVSTFEGDHKRLAGIGPGENPLLWSVKRIAGHPVIYLSGVAKRVGFIFIEHPFVLGCWLFCAVLFRRRPAFRRANIFGLYFLGVHLAFSTEERYFLAVLPIMAALAAVSFLALLTAGEGDAEREGFIMALAGAFPVAAAAVLCMFLLLWHSGAGVKDKGAVLARALSGAPHDAWLLGEYGRLQLLDGDYGGAYRSLGEAAVLAPADITCREDLAVAALLRNRRKGRPSAGADLIEKMPLGGLQDFHPGRYYALKALYELYAGRVKNAEQSVRMAMQARGNYLNFKLKADADAFGRDQERVGDIYITEFLLPELLVYFPAELRGKLAPAFIDLYLKNGGSLGDKTVPGTAPASEKTGAGLPADYDPARDAGADIRTALQLARAGHKRVLVFVGGDWCDWCGKMERFFSKNDGLRSEKEKKYVSVKVFYNPARPPLPPAIAHYPAIAGFPHIYVLAPDGTVLKSQDTSQLESGDTYDRDKILAFLKEWSQQNSWFSR